MDVQQDLNGIRFVWDSNKAAVNARKHRIRFQKACECFFDPFVHTAKVEMHADESRESIIGMTEDWTLLCVTYVLRGDDTFRIISARTVTRTERRNYEAQ